MRSRSGPWLLRAIVVLAFIGALREASIRRHEDDLHDWPRPGDPTNNGAA